MDIQQILNDAEKEVAESLGKETTTDSSTETVEDAPSQEGVEDQEEPEEETTESEDAPDETEKEIPYSRFKQVIKQKNQYKSELQSSRTELSELRGRLEKLEAHSAQVNEQTEIPEWFKNQYSADEADWKAYQQQVEHNVDLLASKINTNQSVQETPKEDEEGSQVAWINEQMDEVALANGIEFDENTRYEVLKIAEKYKPSDDKGDIDLFAAYEMYQELSAAKKEQERQKAEARKKVVADSTTPENSKESSKAKYFTANDFQHGIRGIFNK